MAAPALVALLAMVALLTPLGLPAAARADGDPASDVLAAQSLFLSADGGFTTSEQLQLNALLAGAQRRGYVIRVAVVATPKDLGSVTGLWGMPQRYAQFLGRELSLVYRGTLLVVMPSGFGVAYVGSGAPPGQRLSTLSAPHAGESMVSAALTAVRQLAAAAGVQLSIPRAPTTARGTGSALGSVDAGSWAALAAGALLIALAWGASLRARPLRRAVRRAT